MIITKQDALNSFIDSIRGCSFITIDTEFLREKTYYPKLCLIQISGPEGNGVAIDPLEGNLDLQPVFDLLLDPKVLKVFHAGRQDLEIFYRLLGRVPAPFFDTQIAAMVCGFGDSIGYENLVRNLTPHTIDKSVQYTDWSQRPLSKKQIDYALGDVIYLVDVYKKLLADLEKRGRTSWVYQEEEILAAPATYENHPENAWQRVKVKSPKPLTLAILREVAAWRETQAQERDIPRTWVMRDETLADMAAQAPNNAEKLLKIRNMSPDVAKGRGGAKVLELIQKAKSSDPKTWPRIEKKKILPPSAVATVDILKMLLRVCAQQHDVAAKLISSPEELEEIAMLDLKKEKPDIGALKGWRYEVFGKDALALKSGELAVGLKDGKITRYRITEDIKIYE